MLKCHSCESRNPDWIPDRVGDDNEIILFLYSYLETVLPQLL